MSSLSSYDIYTQNQEFVLMKRVLKGKSKEFIPALELVPQVECFFFSATYFIIYCFKL